MLTLSWREAAGSATTPGPNVKAGGMGLELWALAPPELMPCQSQPAGEPACPKICIDPRSLQASFAPKTSPVQDREQKVPWLGVRVSAEQLLPSESPRSWPQAVV